MRMLLQDERNEIVSTNVWLLQVGIAGICFCRIISLMTQ